MPLLPMDMDDLLAAAGRVAAEERRREQDEHASVEHERAEHREAEARARAEAPANATAVFDWLDTPEASELREAMKIHGVDRVRLGSALGIARGEWRRGERGFGSVSIDLLADGTLRVVVVRGYHGGGASRVTSADALADIVPARALGTITKEVRAGRVLDLVAHGLAAPAL